MPGAPQGAATAVRFLGLLGDPFVGLKRGGFWGTRGWLGVSSQWKRLKKDGLVRRCPQGLCGAPGVCVKGGPSRGPGRGGYSGALSGSSGGPLFWAKKRKISGVCAGSCGFQNIKKSSKRIVCWCGAPGWWTRRLGCAPRGGLPGSPVRVATVVHFLGLLGAPFAGQKSGDFWENLRAFGTSWPFKRAQIALFWVWRPHGRCVGHLPCAPRGGPPGCPEGGAIEVRVLGLGGGPLCCPPNKGGSWGMDAWLGVFSDREGRIRQFLQLLSPRGLCLAPEMCAKGSGGKGIWRGGAHILALLGPDIVAQEKGGMWGAGGCWGGFNGSKMARFCVCGATWGCVASLVCAHKGLPARGS